MGRKVTVQIPLAISRSRFLAKYLRMNLIAMKNLANSLSFAVDFILKTPPFLQKLAVRVMHETEKKIINYTQRTITAWTALYV